MNTHGREHLLKALGGTDPAVPSLPFILVSNDGLGDQLIDTSAAEVLWNPNSPHTYSNAPEVFRIDPDDPAGVLVYQRGFYLCMTTIRNVSGSNAVPRSIYQSAQPLSSGPGVFGNELGFPYGFTLGNMGGNQTEGIADGTTSKAGLTHTVFSSLGDPDDPSRYVVVAAKGAGGADWTISSSQGACAVIIKVSDWVFGHIQPPPGA